MSKVIGLLMVPQMDRYRQFAAAALAPILALSASAQAQQAQVPALHAVSLQRGNAISRTSTARAIGGGNYQASSKSSSRMAAVKVTLRSFAAPAEPYEVQCFFVAKGSGRMRYIFDTKKVLSSAIFDELHIFGKQLDGGSETFEQSATRPTTFGGQPIASEPVTIRQRTTTRNGNTLEGWIVRVVSGGKVVRTEASLQELKVFAERDSSSLDQAAASAPLTE